MANLKGKIIPGQIVILELTGNATRGRSKDDFIREVVIESVGNKYFTLENYKEKFYLETGREKTLYTVNYAIYLTREEITLRKSRNELSDYIRSYFRNVYVIPESISTEQLEIIKEIIEGK